MSDIYRALNVLGASEENVALADRKVGSGRQAAWSRPGVNGFKEDSVSFEDICIGKLLDLGEAPKSSINAGREGGCSRRRTMSGSFSSAILRRYPRVSKSPNGLNVTSWLRADRSPGVSPSRYGRDGRFVKSDQQLFDLVELHIIACKARDVMRKRIAWRPA